MILRLLPILAAVCGSALADDGVFAISDLGSRGRVVTAQFGDFDGDDRKNVMIVTLEGIPPGESRTISVHLQQPDGGYRAAASHSVAVPPFSAVYDVADLRDAPGEELVLLRPDRVTILSIASAPGKQWDYVVNGPSYVAKQPGIIPVESDIQLFLDVPKTGVGDVDGDGQADIVAATRHEIRVFLRADDGSFEPQPSDTLPLKFLSRQDHVRGSGSVVTTTQDIDGDGLLDLVITHIEGTFTDTVTTTRIYRNRGGAWDLDEPDDRFESRGTLSSDLLLDIDGDGTPELLRIQFRFSILEIVELLLTREIDAVIAIHRLTPHGTYEADPWSRKKIGTGLNFETFRPKGFMPRADVDLNGDGLLDFVSSANGKGIEVYLGGDGGPLERRAARQELPTTGVIRFADFDADGLPDILLYDSQEFDAPVRIGRNLGLLP